MGLALSGGTNIYGEFRAENQYKFILAASYFLQKAGWQVIEEVRATAPELALTYPAVGASLQLGGLSYSWVDTLNNAVSRQVFRGATLLESITNLIAAVHGTAGAGTLYSRATLPNPLCIISSSTSASITISSKWPGPAGNGTSSSAGTLYGGGYKLKSTSYQAKATDPTTPLSLIAYISDTGASGLFTQLVSIQIISSEVTHVAAPTMFLNLLITPSPYAASPTVITNATNASPIVLTLQDGFPGVDNQKVFVRGVQGNTAANGSFVCSFDPTYPRTVTLNWVLKGDGTFGTHSVGNGTFAAPREGAKQKPVIQILTQQQRFRIIANRSQFFIYTPGCDGNDAGSFAAAGIPWTPQPECQDNVVAEAADECWWSWSDAGGINTRATPRTCLNSRIGRANNDRVNISVAPSTGSGMFNGILGGGEGVGSLRLISLTGSEDLNFFYSFGGVISPALWVGDKPLWFEPLLAWGESPISPPLIRGQITDALIRTTQGAMDDVDYHTDGGVERTFVCLTDRYFYGTLALIVPDIISETFDKPEANTAY